MDVKCWSCDEPIQDDEEFEAYGEEIRHVECPESTWPADPVKEFQSFPGHGALFVLAARGLRSPWDGE